MNNLSLVPAATVLLIRDSDEGLQVLMVKRSKRPPFENLYVFPGGKIDESDKDQNLQDFCNTLDDKLASSKLGIDEEGSHTGLLVLESVLRKLEFYWLQEKMEKSLI